ncbi:cell division protein ZapA [Roseimarinus sediminis]|jgi:cell division protein ZapA|uniref:cell division protein ZapA n=1 Tax=Roseimarinus sediminis TaxID=1610899 RepID=UPI003D23743D
MDEMFTINIMIAERRYPIRIKRSEEEKIRKAAKIINERILQYQQRYAGKEYQDFMAMATLQFVIELLDLTEQKAIDPAIQQIEDINQELTRYLTKI